MSLFKQRLQRMLLSIPRGLFPVMTLGSRTFIFRSADVREILRRDKDFTLRQINGENISRYIGPFILGMDDGPDYQRDKNLLRNAVHPGDPARIREFFRSQAAATVAALPDHFDLVKEYGRELPWQFLGDYFGCPGPDKESMLRWNRSLFWDVFLDLKHEPDIRSAAVQSAKEMNAYLTELIASHRVTQEAGGELPDNFLTRLMQLQDQGHDLKDAWIRGNVAGVYMGFLEPTNKALVNILNQFYRRKKVWEAARKAAREDDAEAMLGLAMEAMRFHPNAPLLMRYCEKEQHIGGTNRKHRRIRAGKTLFVMTQSAMFDRRAVEHPNRFDPARARDTYLYFGMGLHTCFGNYVNFISIPEMLIALLKSGDPRPVSKPAFEGPFPDSWEWVKA